MKKLSFLTLLLALIFAHVQLRAGNLTVSGQVTDQTSGQPVPFHAVDIVIDTTMFSTFTYYSTVYTDINGNYSDLIVVPSGVLNGTGYAMTMPCVSGNPQWLQFSFGQTPQTVGNLDFAILCNPSGGCSATLTDSSLGNGGVAFFAYGAGAAIPVRYEITFGDGDSYSGPAYYATHNYAQAGTYIACVTVIFADSCIAVGCDTVTVSGGSGLPCQASYYWFPDSSGQYSIIVIDQSVGSGLSYLWDFGDNSTSTLANPSHVYNGPGTYTVCVTITSQNPACTSTYCDSLVVVNKVSSPFSINVISNNATAVEPVAAATVKASIVPNPARDFFQIQMTLTEDADVSVQLMDLSGRAVMLPSTVKMTNGAQSLRIDTQSLPAGVYLAQVPIGDAASTHRVMIAR
jgi:PKD repeat protein